MDAVKVVVRNTLIVIVIIFAIKGCADWALPRNPLETLEVTVPVQATKGAP